MKKGTTNQGLGMLAAFFANFIFGFSFMFTKKALNFANPLVVSAVRLTTAFLAMNVLLLFGVFKINYKGKNLWRLFFMSFAQPLCYFIFELYGIKYTSSALSGLVIALVPVAVIMISAIFSSEKPSFMQVVCTIVSVAGVAVVSALSNDGGKNHVLGVIMLIGAVLSSAVFNVLSRNQSEAFTPIERTYFMFLVGAIGFNIIAFSALGKGYMEELCTASVNVEFWTSIAYLSILSSLVAFIFYNYATTNISAIKASSFANITTVVSVLAGTVIMKEKFSVLQLVLCIPIILGVWGVNLKKD